MGIDDSFHKGLKAYREGNYQDAIQLFQNAVSENEENHKAWNALGVTFSRIGKIEEAVTCYDNALKYDPGNSSYEQNRNQIVHKAFNQLPDSQAATPPRPVISFDYKRFVIPSILLVFVILISLFILFAVPGLLGTGQGNEKPPDGTEAVAPVKPPVFIPVQDENNTTSGAGNNSVVMNQSPVVTPKPVELPFFILGDLLGKYNNGLSELTFTLGIPEGRSPQYLPRVSYLWSVGSMDPIPVLPSNPGTGTIKPGDTQVVTLQLPFNMQPRAGEKYRLEIRPVPGTGDPVILENLLPGDYYGGMLKNPLPPIAGAVLPSATSDEMSQADNESAASTLQSNIMLEGPMIGFYSGELEELTFTLRTPTTGRAQELSKIQYQITTNNSKPITIQKSNPERGTINPGDQQVVTVQIPQGSRPKAGDTIRFEIIPDFGEPIVFSKMLSSSYKGGVII